MAMNGNGNGTNGKHKDPVLVVIQLSGGNDFMNTVIPYTEGVYYDVRPLVGMPEDKVIPITDKLAFHPNASALKEIWDEGKVAIIQGIGYENSSRSHFRAMDIWHTCEPETIATEGWLARVIREMDPNGENPVTAVNFGRGLPRALAAPGVTATSVGDLDNYGLMSNIEVTEERDENLEIFKRMYTPAVGSGLVMDYLGQTGRDVLKGADMLAVAPGIGFGKDDGHNSAILAEIGLLHATGCPVALGASRKSFIGRMSRGEPPKARLPARLLRRRRRRFRGCSCSGCTTSPKRGRRLPFLRGSEGSA